MSGRNVSQSRVTPFPLSVRRVNSVGSPDGFDDEGSLLGGIQVTESFRATREDRVPFIQTAREFNNPTKNGIMELLGQENAGDTGHEFYTRKEERKVSHPDYFAYDPSGMASYRGPLIPQVGDGTFWGKFPQVNRVHQDQVDYYGAKAVSITAPTHPSASLSQFFGELLVDVAPNVPGAALLQSHCSDFRVAGSEYLNVEFGWRPFLSDLQKISRSILSSSKAISQYLRDSGRPVRRRHTFPIAKTSSNTENVNAYASSPFVWITDEYSGVFGPGRSSVVSQLHNEEISWWFSGCFSYLIEAGQTALEKLSTYEQFANKLLGSRITPEVLWELQPWSWLFDWKFDVGQIMSNATLLTDDNLVMRYGYLMRETRVTDTYTAAHPAFKQDPTGGPFTQQLSVVQKERMKATPFGFGLNPDSFTGRQWDILGALGMTRAPRTLL